MCTHIRDERLVSCANRVIGRFCRGATRRARGMADSRYLGFLISGARILTAVTAVQLPDAASLVTKEAHDCVAKLSACRDNDMCWSCITNYDSLEYQQCIRATKIPSALLVIHLAATTSMFSRAARTMCQSTPVWKTTLFRNTCNAMSSC